MKASRIKRAFAMFAALFVSASVMTIVTPTSASAATPRQRVWAGSPIDGQFDFGPPSRPNVHHWLANAADQGDWALDIGGTRYDNGPSVAGQDVRVYIAPDNGAPNVTTKVDQVGPACRNGANGADFVTVGIYQGDGQRIGSITFGHVFRTVNVGNGVNRWGGKIGTVASGLPYNANCWTGPHVHTQLYSNKNYACYNNTYGHQQRMWYSNFIGFTGGSMATGPRQACP